jgi:hypothetical protein
VAGCEVARDSNAQPSVDAGGKRDVSMTDQDNGVDCGDMILRNVRFSKGATCMRNVCVCA